MAKLDVEKVQIDKIRRLLNDAKALRDFLTDSEREAVSADIPDHPLARPLMNKLHDQLMGWFENEKRLQAVNRYQMALDEDYYDSIQWDNEDANALIERGQAPLVYNLIKPAVNWILGTERRSRIDHRVRPRADDDLEGATTKTQVLKYLSDCNNTAFHRSRAFKDAVVAGIGWLEDSLSTTPGDQLIYSGYECWRNIWDDSQSRDPTHKDDRYIFRSKWLDLDVACAIWPDRCDLLQRAARSQDEAMQEDEDLYYLGRQITDDPSPRLTPYTTTNSMAGVTEEHVRERVRVIEAWYKVPEVSDMVYMRGRSEIYDPSDQEQQQAISSSRASLFKAPVLRVRVCLMTEDGILWEGPSPFRHNQFPFTPVICYRRARDGAYYGVVRDLRSPQEDYNKRMSKALHIMATRQAIIQDDATDDEDELREELAAPDGLLRVKKLDAIKIVENQPLIREQVEFARIDEMHISKASGVVDELMGRATNAVSGEAIKSRQLQGSVVTALIFDNFRLAFQIQGEKQLSLVEQFMSEEQVIRLTGAKRDRFITVNQPVPQPDGSIEYQNDLTARKADFVVDAQDYSATVRQAMFDSMMEMLSKFPPEVSMQLLPMVLELVDLPQRDEMVRNVRKALGQPDPDAEMSPEEQQQMAQAQQMQQAAQQLQFQAAQLANEKTAAEVRKLDAQAQAELAKLNEQPDNGESQALTQQLQQVQQQSVQIQTDLKNQIALLQQQAVASRNEIEMKLAAEQEREETRAGLERERMQREDERDARRVAAESASRREIALINTKAQAEIEKAQGASEKALAALSKQIEQLRTRIDEVKKEGEEKVKQAEEKMHHAEDMRKAEEKGRSATESKTEKSEHAAPAAPPVTVNIEAHIEAKNKPKTMKVKKGDDGSYTVSSDDES